MIHIYENVTTKPITLCANIKKKKKYYQMTTGYLMVS